MTVPGRAYIVWLWDSSTFNVLYSQLWKRLPACYVTLSLLSNAAGLVQGADGSRDWCLLSATSPSAPSCGLGAPGSGDAMFPAIQESCHSSCGHGWSKDLPSWGAVQEDLFITDEIDLCGGTREPLFWPNADLLLPAAGWRAFLGYRVKFHIGGRHGRSILRPVQGSVQPHLSHLCWTANYVALDVVSEIFA